MLSEFYITTEDFEHELKDCGSDLANWNGAHHIQRHRMHDLGQDMLGFRESYARAHINATMWAVDDTNEATRFLDDLKPKSENLWVYLSGNTNLPPPLSANIEDSEFRLEVARGLMERMKRRQKSRASIRSQESAWELKAVYKAYFFFIRAFQDACYGVLLNVNGATPGENPRMRNAIDNKNSPVHEKVVAIPGYVEWFEAFRRKRDKIKLGVNVSLCGPQWDVGVSFNQITSEGGLVVNSSPENQFRIGDLVAAFQYCTALLRVIRRDIPRTVSEKD